MHRPLLAIETSGPGGGVALLPVDGKVRELPLDDPAPKTRGRPSGRGRLLLPLIDDLMRQAGVEFAGLKAIAVAIGPGSYTGLRIGVTAAKTLAWSLSCPVAAVSTLEALARDVLESAPADAKRIVPCLDARRGEVYAAIFRREGSSLSRVQDDASMKPSALADLLTDGDCVFGPGVTAYGELAARDGQYRLDGPVVPRPATIAAIGERIIDAGGAVQDVHALAPAYLRREGSEFRKVTERRG